MAKIIDYNELNEGTEIIVHTDTSKIQLLKAGNLSDDGVTLKAVSQFLQRRWKDYAGRTKYDYPFDNNGVALGGYYWITDWDFYDELSRKLIRDSGWEIISNGVTTQIWANITTKGAIGQSDQAYYQQQDGGATTNFYYAGVVNESIQVYSDTNGDGTPDYDYRNYLNIWVRPWGKTFSQSSLADENILELSNTVHTFSLSTQNDPQISATINDIETQEPYLSISVEYFDTDQNRDTGSGSSPYRRIFSKPANATIQQVYEKAQYLLTQNADIDSGAGSVIGKTADAFMEFTSPTTLLTKSGVWIEDILATEKNNITFTDFLGVTHAYPFNAAINLVFGTVAQSDLTGKYWLYFTDPDGTPGNDDEWGTDGAVIVNDFDDAPIQGTMDGSSLFTHSFDYDNNVQGGRTPGEDANVILVFVGTTASYAKKIGLIQRSTANTISIDPVLNRFEI